MMNAVNRSEVRAILRTWLKGVGVIVAAGVGLSSLSGCSQGGEGDRCNPDLSHNPCDDGLSCWSGYDPGSATFCGESYCCPNPPSSSSNGLCNGTNAVSLADGAACMLVYQPGVGAPAASTPIEASAASDDAGDSATEGDSVSESDGVSPSDSAGEGDSVSEGDGSIE